MARVNIEERGVVMAKRLARMCGWTRQHAIGALYCLWHDSQEIEATHCTPEDLVDWLDLGQVSGQADAQAVARALVECGYLDPEEGGRFRIRGNEKHIEALKQKREAAAEGGRKSAEKRAAGSVIRPNKNSDEPNAQPPAQAPGQASAQADAPPSAEADGQARDEPSAVLCSSLQCSSEKKEEEKESPPPHNGSAGGLPARGAAPGNKITADGIRECRETWLATLKGFGIERKILLAEENLILRAIQEHGLEAVRLALFGALFEPANEKWNPKDHVDIARILLKNEKGPKHPITKFVNYGVKEQKRRKDEADKKAIEAEQKARDANSSQSPEQISGFLGKFSKFAKGPSGTSLGDFGEAGSGVRQ